MKLAVAYKTRKYSGKKSYRTSDGWFKGEYFDSEIVVFLDNDNLSFIQKKIIDDFCNIYKNSEHDSRSDGPDVELVNYCYDMEMSIKLSKILSFELIKANEAITNIYKYENSRINYNYFNIVKYKHLTSCTSKQLYIYKFGDKYGLINKEGKQIIPCVYDSISEEKDDSIKVSLKGISSHINELGELILSHKESNTKIKIPTDKIWIAEDFGQKKYSLAIFNNYSGIIDINQNVIIPLEFDCIDLAADFYCIIRYKNKKSIILYSDINKISDPYDEIKYDPLNNVFCVCINKKWGIINSEIDKILIPYIYDELNSNKSFIEVKLNRQVGLYNNNFKQIIQCQYDYIEVPSDSEYCINRNIKVSKNGKYGIINSIGKEFVACKYDMIKNFKENLGIVMVNNKWGAIDEAGKEIFLCNCYDDISDFSNGLARIKNGNKYGLIDRYGRVVVECIYTSIMNEFYGFFIVKTNINNTNYKYGVINRNGQEIIPCMYDLIKYNCIDNFIAKNNNKYFLINVNNESYTGSLYDKIGKSSEGICLVFNSNNKKYKSTGYGYISEYGLEIIPCSYESAGPFSCGLAAVSINKKYGFINRYNEVIVPFLYDEVTKFKNNCANVVVDGNWNTIDINGNILHHWQQIETNFYPQDDHFYDDYRDDCFSAFEGESSLSWNID